MPSRLLGWACTAFFLIASAQSQEHKPQAQNPVRVDQYGDPLPPGAMLRLGTVRLRHILRDWNDYCSTVAFSRDDKIVVSAGDVGVHAWEAATGKKLPWLSGYEGTFAVHFAANGTSLFLAGRLSGRGAGREPIIHEIEIGTGRLLKTIPVNLNKQQRGGFEPRAGSFSLNGKLLLVHDLSSPFLFVEAATGNIVHEHREAKASFPLFRCSIAPDGSVYAVSNKGTAAFHDTVSGVKGGTFASQITAGPELKNFDKDVAESYVWLAFSPDGQTLAGAGQRFLHLLDVRTAKLLREIPGAGGKTVFSPDGKLVISSPILARQTYGRGGALHLFDAETAREVRRFEEHAGHIHALAFSHDGKTLVTGENHTISLWDVATGKRLLPIGGHQGIVTCLAVSGDNSLLASGANYVDPCVIIWDLTTGKLLHRLPKHDRDVACLAFSPDGNVLATGEGAYYDRAGEVRPIRLWDVKSGKLIRKIKAHPGKIADVAFSKDGRLLASIGAEQAPRYWEVASGEPADKFPDAVNLRASVPVGYGGKPIAVSSDGWLEARGTGFDNPNVREASILVLDRPTGQTLARFVPPLQGPTDRISAVVFSPDGNRLVSGGRDTSILVWDTSGMSQMRWDRYWSVLTEEAHPNLAQVRGALLKKPREAMSFLKTRLKPASSLADERITGWIADLDHDEFVVRERAYRHLEAKGKEAELALHRAVRQHPSAEIRQRALQLLRKMNSSQVPKMAPTEQAALHAIPVLEQINTADARELLHALAGGASDAKATREARDALKRLKKIERR